MADQKTVRDVTFDLLRSLELTTVFGNPGSTEETFLKNFPDDFTYVLGLQEASVMAMADGFAQSTGKPALVNVHTAAGTGNAMGSLIAAYRGNTPLIVTAGQQTREMVLCEPYLTNTDGTVLPQPWVKWAYQPARAEDVPAAFMRAYAMALQPPAGPVFLSIPLDDWEKPALGPAVVRTVSHRVSPDAERLRSFADRINRAQRPMLVYGPEVDRSGAWDAGVAFAEKVGAPVYGSPLPDRVSFPENHRLYQGPLPMTIAGAEKTLRGHDLAIVIGAQVFRYYPYVAGEYLPEGTDLLQITSDPALAGAAPVGDSVLGDSLLALEQLVGMVDDHSDREVPAAPVRNGAVEWSASAAPCPGCGVVDPGVGETRRITVGDRVHIDHGPTTAICAHHSPRFVLRHRQWRDRLGSARSRWPGTGRPCPRRQAHGGGDHRRRVLPVLGAGDVHGGPTPATGRVRRHAQRGVLDSQVVRGARGNTGCSGSGPTGT